MEAYEVWWERLGIYQLQEEINAFFPGRNLNLEELFQTLLQGDFPRVLYLLFGEELSFVAGRIQGMEHIFVWLLLLGALSAILGTFINMFDKEQVADLSFYVIYLGMTSILFCCFQEIMQTTSQTIEHILLFIKLLIPTYLTAVGVTGQLATASATYAMVLFLVYLVQKALVGVVLPMISCYMILSVVNGIWTEEKLGLFAEFVAKAVSWLLKGILGLVTGVSFFQAMLAPALDQAKNSVLRHSLDALPGIGGTAGSVLELTLGSALVIKNSVGILLLLLLLLACFSPLAEIFLVSFLLKFSAALMGIVSDKRVTACADKAGEAGMLLFRTAATALLLFVVSLAVTSLSIQRW